MAERKKKTAKKATRRSIRSVGTSTSESGGSRRVTPAARPPVTAPVVQAPPTVRMVTVRNRTGQMISASVINDDGAPTQLRLGPYATSDQPEDRLTEYTRSLASQGKLTIDPLR